MKTSGSLWLTVCIILAILGVTFPFLSCSAQPEQAKAEKVINVMGLWDITGPVSPQIKHSFRGHEDYIKYLNEKGGINGIRVQSVWADTSYDPSRAVAAFHRLAAEKPTPVFGAMEQSGDSVAVKPLAESYKIPVMATNTEEVLVPPGWMFNQFTMTRYATMAFGDWVMEDWAKKGGKGAPKMAIVGPDNAFGRDPMKAEEYLKKIGIDFRGFEAAPWLPTDTTATLTRLRDSGINYAFCQWQFAAMAVFLKDAQRLGLLDKITIVSGPWTYPAPLPGMIGDVAEGHLHMIGYATAYHDVPGVKEAVAWAAGYHGAFDYPNHGNYFYGWTGALVGAEAVKRALNKVGYDKLNGTAVKAELEAMKDFDTGGLIGPVSFGPDRRYGTQYVQMCVIKGGKQVPLTDWFKTKGS